MNNGEFKNRSTLKKVKSGALRAAAEMNGGL
jgi:hypothetical protein